MSAPFSVIIPAHNEERVIARCLTALLADVAPGEVPEIVVACNGCTDRTAEIAREVAPAAIVIEIVEGSKPRALNAGNAVATALPRFFVDADIVVSHAALSAAAAALCEPGVMAAAPALSVDLSRCDRFVAAYCRIWLSQPYVTDGLVGSGVYGLSAAGLEAVGSFPPIIADDGYVRTRFPPEARKRVAEDGAGRPIRFTVFPPRRTGDLIRIESRRRAGDAQLAAHYPSPYVGRVTSAGSLAKAATSPIDKAIYLAIKLAGRVHYRISRAFGRSDVWRRDESSRRS